MSAVRWDLVTLGETLALLTQPGYGPLAASRSLDVHIGGAESNVAIAASRLGLRSAWISRVGADPLGELVVATIRGQGVDVFAAMDAAAPTALMIKERRTPEIRLVHYYREGSAGSRLRSADLPEDVLRRTRLLHLSGITLALSPAARVAALRAIEIAKAAGALISLDLNYRAKLWARSDAMAAYSAVLPQIDMLFGGPDEIAMAADGAATHSFDPAVLAPTVVVKAGAAGATGYERGRVAFEPALDVAVIDTVGAGDAFVAGFLAGAVEGLGLDERLRLAHAVAAFVCGSEGDWEGSPSRTELALLGDADGVIR